MPLDVARREVVADPGSYRLRLFLPPGQPDRFAGVPGPAIVVP